MLLKFQDAKRTRNKSLPVPLLQVQLKRHPAVTAGYWYNRTITTVTGSSTANGMPTEKDSATRLRNSGLATNIFIG